MESTVQGVSLLLLSFIPLYYEKVLFPTTYFFGGNSCLRRPQYPPQSSPPEHGGHHSTPPAAVYDTLAAPDASAVSVNGYDKPLRSRRETFFTTNNTDRNLARIAFTIRYFDARQRQLHQTKHNIPADIPAGETRQISVPSWDHQFNFYYIRSTIPQRAQQATPYDVRISIDTLFFEASTVK